VKQFVAASGRPADEVIAVITPRRGPANIEAIAVNAVMAGCRPEFMPVVIAAIEAITDPQFPLEPMQVSTNAMTPFCSLTDQCGTRLTSIPASAAGTPAGAETRPRPCGFASS